MMRRKKIVFLIDSYLKMSASDDIKENLCDEIVAKLKRRRFFLKVVYVTIFVLFLILDLGDLVIDFHEVLNKSNVDVFVASSLLFFYVLSMRIVFWTEKKYVLMKLRKLFLTKNLRPRICINCNYDLHGSMSLHCPECGCELPKGRIEEKVMNIGLLESID